MECTAYNCGIQKKRTKVAVDELTADRFLELQQIGAVID